MNNITGHTKETYPVIKTNVATSGAVSYPSPTLQGTSLDSLQKMYNITSKALYPFTSGNSVIKFNVQYSDLPKGTGNGYNKPAGCIFTSLVR